MCYNRSSGLLEGITSNACITKATDTYLLTTEPPKNGKLCR